MKRPGFGISPIKIKQIYGKKAKKNLSDDYIIRWSDIKKQSMKKKNRILFMIMAGGVGKRLRPYTYALPKPLLTANNISPLES